MYMHLTFKTHHHLPDIVIVLLFDLFPYMNDIRGHLIYKIYKEGNIFIWCFRCFALFESSPFPAHLHQIPFTSIYSACFIWLIKIVGTRKNGRGNSQNEDTRMHNRSKKYKYKLLNETMLYNLYCVHCQSYQIRKVCRSK